MLDENYNCKVIDFGDAKKVDEPPIEDEDEPLPEEEKKEDEFPQQNHPLQRRGTFVGTVNYQSPEVIQEEEQGLPVDIWALGNILFKMLTGVVPFRGTQQFSVYKDIKNRNIGWPEPEVIDQVMSPEAKDLIDRMI